MKVRYDRAADAFYVRLGDDRIIDSEEVQPGVILDFNEHDQVVGIEVLGLRGRVASEDLARIDVDYRDGERA